MSSRTTNCPCCFDPMPANLVTCWLCYRLSQRLTPGVWLDEDSRTTFTITQADVDRFEALRAARSSA